MLCPFGNILELGLFIFLLALSVIRALKFFTLGVLIPNFIDASFYIA